MGLSVGAGAGIALALVGSGSKWLLIAMTAFVLVTGSLVDPWISRLGWRSALFWVNAPLFTMFVLHPAGMIVYGRLDQAYHLQFDLRPTYVAAQVVALTACAAINLGYFLHSRSRVSVGQLAPPTRDQNADDGLHVSFAFALVILGLLLFSIFSLQSGRGLSGLIGGNLSGDNSAGSTAYFYLGPYLLIPAVLLFFRADAILARLKYRIPALGLLAWLGYAFSQNGQRLHMLLVFGSVAIYASILRQPRSPHRARRVIAAVLVAPVLLILLVSLRDVGGGNTVREQVGFTLAYPEKRLEQLLTSADTEMLDALALQQQVVPDPLPHAPGRTVYSVVGSAVPRAFWASKPVSADGYMNAYVFSGRGVTALDASVAYSFAGTLFLDSGHMGVALGFFLLGLAVSVLSQRLSLAHRRDLVLAVSAATLPLLPVLLRGNPEDTLARALYVVGPLLLLMRLQGKARS